MSVNKVILVGNVGKDPEVRYLDGNGQNGQGTKVATFTLATSERYRDRGGELRENTEWHNIVAWRQSADIVERFVKKGTQLYIEGKLRTRAWNDQTGAKRYTTEITVDTLQLLGKRDDNVSQGYSQSAAPSYQSAAPAYRSAAPSYQAQPKPQEQPVPQAPIDLSIGEEPTDDLPF